MKFKLIIILTLLLLNFSCKETDKSYDYPFSKTEISENILMIGFGSDVITAIKTDSGIIIIDSGCALSLTKIYRLIIENHFNCTDFTYLINTHAHYDHCAGNDVFNDAIIIGHKNCEIEFAEQTVNIEQKTISLEKVFRQYQTNLSKIEESDKIESIKQVIKYRYAAKDYKKYAETKQGHTTFNDTLNLQSGSTEINLIYFGNLHSRSDILIYIPQEKVLFTGDLFFSGGRASVDNSITPDSLQWEFAAKQIYLYLDNIEFIIGGHGQILETEDLKSFFSNLNLNTKQ